MIAFPPLPFHPRPRLPNPATPGWPGRNQLTIEPGLQCHTAPFSWKLVFECDHQLYEIIMTACTPKEEMEWRSRISRQATDDGQTQTDAVLFSSLSLNLKTLGAVFRKPG